MSLVINTNIASLNTQNNLTKSQNALNQATQRLSSGLKINSASDNAAGYAISQRYTTQVGGLTQASANASDAINLTQTAGSALDQVTSNLQAIRDLAAQSANGTYSDADRATIDKEVQQRLLEVTRIANQTTFNGKKVLDGSLATQSFQIGADVGQTVSVALGTGVKASQLGAIAQTTSGDISSKFASPAGLTLAAGDLTVTNAAGTATAVTGSFTSAAALASAINTAAGSTTLAAASTAAPGELVLDNSSTTTAVNFGGAKAASLGLSTVATRGAHTTAGSGVSTGAPTAITGSFNAVTLAAGDFTVDGTSITGTFSTAGELASAIQAQSTLTAVDDGTGKLKLTNSTGAAVAVGGTIATDLGVNGSLVASTGTSTSSLVATEVTAKHNAVELSAGQLTIGGASVTGVFKDAASLVTRINALSTAGLSASVNPSGEIAFSNTSTSAIAIGGSLNLGLPTSVTAQTTATTDGAASSSGVASKVAAAAGSSLTLAAGDLSIGGTAITGTFSSVQDLSDAINAANTGVSAAVSGNGKGINLYSATDITVAVGTTGSLSASTLASATATASATNSLQGSDVKNVDDANALLSRIDVALGSVSNFAAQLGAVQNRFQSTISTLSSQTTNLQSAQSTIQDADFAAETANLSKAGVLQQAGISVLAQANSRPQQVLKLLQ